MNSQQGTAGRVMRRALCLALPLALCAACALAQSTVYGSGVVQPKSQPVVFAAVDATVADILVELGDSVTEGDVIVALENDALALEVSELEHAVMEAQEAVQDVRTRERFRYEMRVDEETGAPIRLGGDGEIIYDKYSNELNIRAPMGGRVMAVYIDVGDDALGVYREKGSVIMISTDGRMKVELDVNEDVKLELDQKVLVQGEGVEAEGVVVELTRRGLEAIVQVNSDKYPMDTPVTVTTLNGEVAGEGILEINKPVGVTAYGGIIREVSTYVGQEVKRQDILAMFTWESEPLYIDNTSVLRDYDKAVVSYETTREKLNKLTVTAPCSGKIASINVALDDTVEDGTQLLTIVEEDAGMEVILSVDELDIVQVQPGQRVVMELHALEDVTLEGTVEKIAPLGNTETAVTRYDVYVTIDEADERVMGGMNVSGEIIIE